MTTTQQRPDADWFQINADITSQICGARVVLRTDVMMDMFRKARKNKKKKRKQNSR